MFSKIIRTGRVQYVAGYEQTRWQIGQSPVYRTARVEELSDGTLVFYPAGALANATDGGLTLPAHLVPEVAWES